MNNSQLDKNEGETLQKIEAIYNDTTSKIKILEQEQKNIVSDYLKQKEQEKIEQIRKLLLN